MTAEKRMKTDSYLLPSKKTQLQMNQRLQNKARSLEFDGRGGME